MPFEQKAKIAEGFLQEHHLLDFPYQVVPVDYDLQYVHFATLLDGIPVVYGGFGAPQIDVRVDAQGEVRTIFYYRMRYNPIKESPFSIISAEEAWQQVLTNAGPQGMENGNRQMVSAQLKTWIRHYQTGVRSDLYGYAETLQPAEPGGVPFAAINNIPMTGDILNFVASASPFEFLHVWGQLKERTDGGLALQLEGWEPSASADETLTGSIQRQGDRSILITEGQSYLLPDLPGDVPRGETVMVRGVRLQGTEPQFDWSTIQFGEGGGGGGGGGGNFTELDLTQSSPAAPTPELVPTLSYQPGDGVDALEGTVYVTIYTSPDGSQRKEIKLFCGESDAFPQGMAANLVGPGIEGIESLNRLPARVWGKFTDTSLASATIEVSRYEEASPGLRFQAWLGRTEVVTMDGQEVLLLTTQEGDKFVLQSSMNNTSPDIPLNQPGELVIVEGLLRGQTFADYPVIEDTGMGMAQGRTDLEGYEINSDDPLVLGEESQTQGKATIEKIELVYYATDLTHGSIPKDMPPLYVQPVWRFYGHYQNDAEFYILVQALRGEYFK